MSTAKSWLLLAALPGWLAVALGLYTRCPWLTDTAEVWLLVAIVARPAWSVMEVEGR